MYDDYLVTLTGADGMQMRVRVWAIGSANAEQIALDLMGVVMQDGDLLTTEQL